MELTQEQKLNRAFTEHPNMRTLKALLEYEQVELLQKLRKTKDESDFRHVQGQLHKIDQYLELLTKVV